MKRIRVSKAFLITMLFFFFIFGLFSITQVYSSDSIKNEIIQIDNKINELTLMKRGYESKAIKHASEGNRLQFIEGELQRAKQHWKLAEENTKIAAKIQEQINELETKKNELLNQNKK